MSVALPRCTGWAGHTAAAGRPAPPSIDKTSCPCWRHWPLTRCPDCERLICKTCLEEKQCQCQEDRAEDRRAGTGTRMSRTNVESMAIKRCRRGKYVVATEKSVSSTSDFIVGVVGSIWPDAQTPYSACSTRCIGYNHREGPAAVAGAMPSGKSQFSEPLHGDNGAWFTEVTMPARRENRNLTNKSMFDSDGPGGSGPCDGLGRPWRAGGSARSGEFRSIRITSTRETQHGSRIAE